MKINQFPFGEVKIPISKSIGHRVIICSALAGGQLHLDKLALSLDLQATKSCCEQLIHLSTALSKEHVGSTGATQENALNVPTFNCGESGSTLRFMIPLVLALCKGADFTGQGRLLDRPLDQYEEIFKNKGVEMCADKDKIKVRGELKSGVYELRGDVSSQFVTGLLLSLPLVKGDSEIRLTTPLQSKGYVDLTLSVMKDFGIEINRKSDECYLIQGGQHYRHSKADIKIESDFSQAAFFLVTSALGCNVWCKGLNLNSQQGDRVILDILQACGATITKAPNGAIRAVAHQLHATDVDVSQCPDLVPPLVALLAFCEGESRIYNAGRLRMKESDRLSACVSEFGKMGVQITEGDDYLIIRGSQSLKVPVDVVQLDSHNDHRIAMGVAVAAYRSKNQIELSGEAAVNKSYPSFWQDFCKDDYTPRSEANEYLG